MKSPMDMNKKRAYKKGLLLVVMCLSWSLVFSQSKESLQKEKEAIAEKIAYAKKLLSESRKNEQSANTQLQLLEKQILFRKQLIGSIGAEIDQIEKNIEDSRAEIEHKEEYIVALKAEYKEMVYQSYKNRSAYNKVMYIFASESFDQAYKRLKTMQSYTESRQKQADEIVKAQKRLQEEIDALESIKLEKAELLTNKQEENQNLEADKKQKDAFLSKIQSEQSKLDKEIKKQIAEREKINKAIRKIIEAETKSSGVAMTPEGRIVSTNFEKNKGSLPWPVSRGIITQGFGKQAHRSLAGIYTENNGVDIATDANAQVSVIFDGTVTSVFDIPGAGRNIIVTHGAYKTIYSNLKEANVKKGDAVSAREVIGKVMAINGENTLHFELWKVSSSGSNPINPATWISN